MFYIELKMFRMEQIMFPYLFFFIFFPFLNVRTTWRTEVLYFYNNSNLPHFSRGEKRGLKIINVTLAKKFLIV